MKGGEEEGGVAAKARPSMISAKYRLKEERRKVLKMSIAKVRKIEDPESSLRRSVLINNTMKRLQREARDEKALQRQAPALQRRKRSFNHHQPDVDECEEDVQDVLSQFYMPPTPRMLTSIDDGEEVEEEGEAVPPSAKRLRLRPEDPLDLLAAAELSGPQDVDMTLALHAAGLATRVAPDAPSDDRPFWPTPSPSPPPSPASSSSSSSSSSCDGAPEQQHYSCGHTALFGEIQSVVYHSLIASLES